MDKDNERLLQAYLFTVNEYEKFIKPEKNTIHDWLDPIDPDGYRLTIANLLLLRKYTSFNEPVYLGSVLDVLATEYPQRKEDIQNFRDRLQEIETSKVTTLVEKDSELSLRETVELELYGIYLHADYDKIEKIVQTDPNLRFIAIRRYVDLFADLVIRIADFIRECSIQSIGTPNVDHAKILRITKNEGVTQNIKSSPYWSHLYGRDAADDELFNNVLSMDPESLEIFVTAVIFLHAVENENTETSDLQRLVYRKTRRAWGNFNEVRDFLKSHKDYGLSTYVRFNTAHDIAYVYMLDNVKENLIIEDFQIIDGVTVLSLVKDGDSWKVYSIGEKLETYHRLSHLMDMITRHKRQKARNQ